jgi:hypothetical protein
VHRGIYRRSDAWRARSASTKRSTGSTTRLGYQPTPPQDPKIERDRLADELARAADHFKSLERAVERLNTGTKISAVK